MSPRLQAYFNNLNASNVDEFVSSFVKSDCARKKLIKVTDKLTKEIHDIYVPCGKCLHCRAMRIADWSSRMCLHTEYCRKYVYFVTLTYRSFGKYSLIPSPLLDAYWRYDNINKTHRYGFSPCLLRHEHFQRFMKYLRKQYPAGSLDFFMCGEMGERYGRPHFHCILWSDNPVTLDSLRKAWSVNISKSRKYPNIRAIGNVRLDDLQANGTLVSHCGKNAFRYVAKYCCKSFIDSSYMQNSRFGLFLRDLRDCKLTDDQLRAVFSKRVRSIKSLMCDFAHYIAPFVRSLEQVDHDVAVRENELLRNIDYSLFSSLYLSNLKYLYNHVPKFHDKNLPDTSYLSSDWLSEVDDTRLYQIMVYYYQHKCNSSVLEQVFSPYCLSSKSNAIGKRYALDHIEDFARGCKNLPSACNSRVFFPRYFSKLTEEYVTRYYRLSPKVCSTDYKAVPLACDVLCRDYLSRVINQDVDPYRDADVFSPYGFVGTSRSPQFFLKSAQCLKDMHTGCRLLLTLTPDGMQYDSYRYSRSLRQYVFVDSISTEELLESFAACSIIAKQYNKSRAYIVEQSTQEYQSILDCLKAVCTDSSQLISDAIAYEDYRFADLRILDNARNTNPLLE